MARGRTSTTDRTTLQMALVGYEIEKQKIEETIRQIQKQLGGRRGPAAAAEQKKTAPKKRVLSAAARRRISAAQRRRWAEHRRAARAAKSGKAEA